MFLRMRGRLDRGETIPPQITISFDNTDDLLKVLTAERVRLLRFAKRGTVQVAKLAKGLHRDVRAVNRDVTLLESAGLLRTHFEANPGHGRMKVVEPVAHEYKLTASI